MCDKSWRLSLIHILPKGTDFSSLTRQKVKEIEAWMNDYPREKLGWKSANRAIAEQDVYKRQIQKIPIKVRERREGKRL